MIVQNHNHNGTYFQCSEIIIGFYQVPYRLVHNADDPIDDVHDSISGHLVAMNDPGAIHSDNLLKQFTLVILKI